jgi:DNA repair protein RadD
MFQLRPYQQSAVNATLHHFRRSRSPAVIVLPTGAGKSLVIASLAKVARGRVLVLAHVKELVEQNYAKFQNYKLDAGIFSAGLNQKDSSQKVIFGSIQSVARADKIFFNDFSLLVIDECHRVSGEDGTQYTEVIEAMRVANPDLCILGLTATPYRLDIGWIYQYNHHGFLCATEDRLFKKCIFEISLKQMIEAGYLTPPVQIDAPVASYDFSSLKLPSGQQAFNLSEIEAILKDQSRVTPIIIQNIIEMSDGRKGVIIFTASVRHAKEILSHLPRSQSAIIIGDMAPEDRDRIIAQFRDQRIRFLVNVSVLTTGFDAPHVDLIAILRPTESVSLYQQIVGRGLRLFEGKTNCLVLDYTGVPHDIFSPIVSDKKPRSDCVPVSVPCPQCDHTNTFWGTSSQSGDVAEHFGTKCAGAIENPDDGSLVPCGFRYRFKDCESCATQNDIDASHCIACQELFIDGETKLKAATAAKDTHIMRPDTMFFERKVDSKGGERLEIRYYDLDAQHLTESFYFDDSTAAHVFYYNFIRMHQKNPGVPISISSAAEAIRHQHLFRLPLFIIARKQKGYWKVREKVFL